MKKKQTFQEKARQNTVNAAHKEAHESVKIGKKAAKVALKMVESGERKAYLNKPLYRLFAMSMVEDQTSATLAANAELKTTFPGTEVIVTDEGDFVAETLQAIVRLDKLDGEHIGGNNRRHISE